MLDKTSAAANSSLRIVVLLCDESAPTHRRKFSREIVPVRVVELLDVQLLRVPFLGVVGAALIGEFVIVRSR